MVLPSDFFCFGVFQSLSVGFDALGGSLNKCLLGSYCVPDSAVGTVVQLHILKTDAEFSVGKAWLLLSLPPLHPLLGSPRSASLCWHSAHLSPLQKAYDSMMPTFDTSCFLYLVHTLGL